MAIKERGLYPLGGSGLGVVRTAMGTYDFAVDGGTFGSSITLRSNAVIPINAIIIGGFINLITPLTGGTVTDTISLGTTAGSSATSLVNAAARNATPWATPAGIKAIVPVYTGATAVKMTAAGSFALIVNATSITAGKFDIIVQYMVGSA